MLTRWTLENFKPIRGRLDVKLAPLTVLAGLNSSGKSSFLQSVLLVAQTLANQKPDEPLVLNGRLVLLGTFQDVCNDRASEQRIQIGFSLDGAGATPVDLCFDVSDSHPSVPGRLNLARVEMHVPPSRVAGNGADAEPTSIHVVARRANLEEEGSIVHGVLSTYSVPYPEGENYVATVEARGSAPLDETALVRWAHFLPQRFVVRRTSGTTRLRSSLVDLINTSRTSVDDLTVRAEMLAKFIQPFAVATGADRLSAAIREGIERVTSKHGLPPFTGTTSSELAAWLVGLREDLPRERVFVPQLVDAIFGIDPRGLGDVLGSLPPEGATPMDAAVKRVIDTFTGGVRYLGPLRQDPQASMSFSESGEPDDVGSRGEHAAAVYAFHHDRMIHYFHPTSETVEVGTLAEAMNTWIQYLGVADSVTTAETGLGGVAWQVRSGPGARERQLAGVGVGVSQVLPILVAGLLMPSGTILIMEQPELHLHERPQARLGDFLYGLTRTGKQVLVETHSAVLIGQLRYRMVRGGSPAQEAIAIYFVSQDGQGEARFEPIQISRRGAIENWPDGFFDESFHQEDRITQEGIRRQGRREALWGTLAHICQP